ncbi:Gfo/Idh/MocA family protein [Prauserella rugosa]|uniref:Putative dehydrogenase n=1 Tax=Prauserella rugosa TaxID=43354 RepID=A0A660C887_9PSEU|nr:Gfo/Idh/MocA family oxidoreductase [Prauserella rugosa]KMS87306.1 oxidoreductase [Streptomyces regensis]TWH19790.1 putative dehydrogenase [Prauserella rugosa]
MTIRTAVVGFGTAGSVFHAPFLHRDESYSLEFVVTGDQARGRQATNAFPGVTVLGDVAALWERASDVDLVIVATPPATHATIAATALDAGLHVVVDKPFATSSAQARTLVDHARRAGRVLTVYQNRRWDGDFLTLRELVEAGELGTVYGFESRFEWWAPDGGRGWKASASVGDGGGMLFDLGTHLIDQAVQLFGPVDDLWADTTTRGTDNADDDSVVVLRHAGGTRSRLTMSGFAALPAPRFHVLGSKSAFTIRGMDPQEDALLAGAAPGDAGFGVRDRAQWPTVGTRDDQRRIEPRSGDYGEFYRRLADAIRGEADVPVDPNDAVEVLELVERAHRSVARRREPGAEVRR